MRYRLQRHDGTDCSATMVPITVLRMVPIQRYRHYGNKMLLIVIIILCIGIIITKCYYRLDVYGYATPVVICLASALFLLFKSLNMNWNIANKLAPYCLGIYLMHPVFINFVYKFLNINEEMVVPILNFIGFFLLFTL